MKKFNLINSIAIVVCTVLVAVLSSCSELMPGDGKFVVKEVSEGLERSKYWAVQIKGKGGTYFYDERGKYHVGDTISIGKYCN